MNGHIVTPFRRRPGLFRYVSHRQHASSGWGEAPLAGGTREHNGWPASR